MRQPRLKMIYADKPLSPQDVDEMREAMRKYNERGSAIMLPFNVHTEYETIRLKPHKPNRYPSLLAHKVTR